MRRDIGLRAFPGKLEVDLKACDHVKRQEGRGTILLSINKDIKLDDLFIFPFTFQDSKIRGKII